MIKRTSHEQKRETTPEIGVLHTLIYSDIFDFPLTEDEIVHYFKSPVKYSRIAIRRAIASLIKKRKIIFNQYYSLENKQSISKRRLHLKDIQKDKLLFSMRIANFIKLIPTIYFIGISGSVAAGNAQLNDDIDLIIIVKKKTIWKTRLMLLLLLEILNVRRKKNTKQTANKICPNLILDETALHFRDNSHDTYTAHELAQIVPLFNRYKTYEKLLHVNTWTQSYMPNISPRNIKPTSSTKNILGILELIFYLILNIPGYEYIARIIQRLSIYNTKTNEIISDSMLAFHPNNTRRNILHLLDKRLREYR